MAVQALHDTIHRTVADHLTAAIMLARQAFSDELALDTDAAEELVVGAAAELIQADKLLTASGRTWSGVLAEVRPLS